MILLVLLIQHILQLAIVVKIGSLWQNVHECDGKEDPATKRIGDAKDLRILIETFYFYGCEACTHRDCQDQDDEDPFGHCRR